MKLALLLALSVAAVGVTLVASAPEAEACYSPCSVGPCDVYREPRIFTTYVAGRQVRLDGAQVSCDPILP